MPHETSILERRRIEAEFAKSLLAELEPVMGREAAIQALASTAGRLARQHANQLAIDRGMVKRTLRDLAALLPLWEADGALEVSYLERTDERLSFNVTRCRYAEMYRSMGAADLGASLSCGRDGAFCSGFNPAVQFERTQTIMGGAAHCDFRYIHTGEDK